jgi:uncharacterized protein (TIGR02231 family)
MTIHTDIKEVHLSRSGFTAVRRGCAHLEAGETRVLIEGLCATSYTDTVQLFFPAAVSASAIHVINPDHEGKQSELIREQIDDIDAALEALQKQAEMWQNSTAFAQMQSATVEQVESWISAYPERIRAISSEKRRLEKEKKALDLKLNEEFEKENRPLVSAVLKVENSGDYPFEMRCQDYAGSWNSQYEIHTDGEGPLSLRARAQIRQNTGEDWKGVRMVLRTGMPVRFASLPQLKPLYLDFEKPMPRPRYSRNTAPVMMKAMMADVMTEEAAMEDTAQLFRMDTGSADVNTSDTMTEYVLGAEYDVASGDEGMFVDLQTFELNADYVIRAVPKKDIHAYLLASVKTADLPMSVRGTASVYLNSAYTGSALIAPDYGEDTFTIALGTEERISLSRTEKKKQSKEALIRNQQSAVYEYDIQAVSGMDEPVTVDIIDQIPVSRDQGITVDRLSYGSAEYDETTGILKWKAELSCHEMKTLHVEYRVTWPKDKQVETVSE